MLNQARGLEGGGGGGGGIGRYCCSCANWKVDGPFGEAVVNLAGRVGRFIPEWCVCV